MSLGGRRASGLELGSVGDDLFGVRLLRLYSYTKA